MIVRELRAESRNLFNYWSRIIAASVVITVFIIVMLDQRLNPAQLGARLFYMLTTWLFFSIIALVPVLTADCISREKREGTLGLLFLTPLTANEIVLGKSLIHMLRAVTLVLAALPIISLPFLLGGVTGEGIVRAVILNVSGLLVALAAGMCASIRNTEWVRAAVTAELFALGFAFILVRSHYVLQIGIALVFFVVTLANAGRRLEDRWQMECTEPPQPSWVKIFSNSNFWQSVFRWNKSRTLDRNPIAWLQEYSWTARLTKWGWLLAILVSEVYFTVASLFRYSFFTAQIRIATVLAVGVAFSAAWSFQRDRQSGALELLLVTPLQAPQLVLGRIWGIWCHFFPALAMLFFLWIYAPYRLPWSQVSWIVFFAITFLTLPVIGLAFSLARWNFFIAWLSTLATGFVLPYFVFNVAWQARLPSYAFSGALQLIATLIAWRTLQSNLRNRKACSRVQNQPL